MGQDHNTDPRLSLRARGLMGYLLTLPAGSPMGADTLAKQVPEGRDAIRAALRQLRETGYLDPAGNPRTTGDFQRPTGGFQRPSDPAENRRSTGDFQRPPAGNPSTEEEVFISNPSSTGGAENPRPAGNPPVTDSFPWGSKQYLAEHWHIAVNQPWRDAWALTRDNEDYDAKVHLDNYLVDCLNRNFRPDPGRWLRFYRDDRERWLLDVTAKAKAQDEEVRYFERKQYRLNHMGPAFEPAGFAEWMAERLVDVDLTVVAIW